MNDYKFLKKIKSHSKYNYNHASESEKEQLDRLIASGHISYNHVDEKHAFCKITSLGEDYIADKKAINIKWGISLFFSIVSFIISFLTLMTRLQ